ncbi:hypothetical protein [Niveispirillum irakense]|uniref:hypothetical protein n=1 Tax=Niveispirillum irakense TaxID=34011 RepID=UPI00042A376F|nr:hypothetical protein [Niveispirillum irakense]
MSEARTTQDHRLIRQWVEARNGRPAHVKASGDEEDIGVLRILFADGDNHSAGALEPVSWEDFFAKFEERELCFLYQEETETNAPSRFNKLISRHDHE